MALPLNTHRVLESMGWEPEQDFRVFDYPEGVRLDWLSQDAQPTEQAINDRANDLTIINGQTFSQWLAEHGGDAIATAKRLAKERLDDRRELLATLLLVASEINILRTWLRDFKTQTALATNLANFQTRVAGLATLLDRTDAQVLAAAKTTIDA